MWLRTYDLTLKSSGSSTTPSFFYPTEACLLKCWEFQQKKLSVQRLCLEMSTNCGSWDSLLCGTSLWLHSRFTTFRGSWRLKDCAPVKEHHCPERLTAGCEFPLRDLPVLPVNVTFDSINTTVRCIHDGLWTSGSLLNHSFAQDSHLISFFF